MEKHVNKRLCYGFDKNYNGEWVANKDAINVLHIFNQYLQGNSIRGVIEFLKEGNVSSPSGKSKWTPRAIEKILATEEETAHSPILITAEIKVENGKHIRCFYWLNYNKNQGCLFDLPKTKLEYEIKDGKITISNIGELPAVGVTVTNTVHDTEFTVEDNVFWLSSGEKRTLNINCSDGIEVKAWNA